MVQVVKRGDKCILYLESGIWNPVSTYRRDSQTFSETTPSLRHAKIIRDGDFRLKCKIDMD
jgi:hypothetical protein